MSLTTSWGLFFLILFNCDLMNRVEDKQQATAIDLNFNLLSINTIMPFELLNLSQQNKERAILARSSRGKMSL